MKNLLTAVCVLALAPFGASAGEGEHSHPVPDKLGTVHFQTSCAPAVQAKFDHAIALLHSFTYDPARNEFAAIADEDPTCAMAHWGVAMSMFHQLWSPPAALELNKGAEELSSAERIGAQSERERALITAASMYFSDSEPAHHASRAKLYEQAMQSAASRFAADDEVQVLYALALIATAPPTDRTHANQKRGAAILEPIYLRQPNHPGAVHYLIHAYDSTELAARGLPAARAYSKIAPSAPHALHMPSHIFTRLGLWNDSIESNEAARRAAHAQGDVGEELHAMDYLTYAFLQRGRVQDAEQIVQELRAKGPLLGNDFKVGYAAAVMPVRLAIELGRWSDVLDLQPLPGAAPHVAAIAHWARALGHARTGHPDLAAADVAQIDSCEGQSRASGDSYWSTQVGILATEARAWSANAAGHSADAIALLQAAAEREDSIEKLPVTPGPIVPAREQLGQLLLELHRPREALRELTHSLEDAPGRRAGLQAAARASEEAGDPAAAAAFRRLTSG